MFIALHLTQEKDEKILHAFSTRVMLWDEKERIWLIDLRPFLSYWHSRAQTSRLPLPSVLRKVLHKAFATDLAEHKEDVLELTHPFQAACAPSPWLALLLLLSLLERKTKTFVFWEQDFGRMLFKELSWSVWWQGLGQVEQHLPSKEKSSFAKGSKRLEDAVGRLGFRKVQNLNTLNFAGMRRRFGKGLAETWQWTFESELFSTFPWKSFSFTSPIEIPRHLEFPLQLWEQMAPLLCEDLDRLCENSDWHKEEFITKLLWKVTFDDLSIVSIPIEFRHPHDLRKQKGTHATTLLQAYYSFKGLVEDAIQGDPPYPSVLSWRLVLEQSVVIPSWVKDLFGDALANDDDELLQVENELSIPLQRFCNREDWLPEDSFAPQTVFPAPVEQASFKKLALRRPLFLYKEPQNCLIGTEKPVFLESTMTKWWRPKERGQRQRQYYKCTNEKGQAFWVYQDSSGRWFRHGNFG